MKTQHMIDRLRDAIKAAGMENVSLGNCTGFQDKPVTFKDGRLVTEHNVTEFIRERLEAHHYSWIIGPVEEVLNTLRGTIKHEFEAYYPGGVICQLCSNSPHHKLHWSAKK